MSYSIDWLQIYNVVLQIYNVVLQIYNVVLQIYNVVLHIYNVVLQIYNVVLHIYNAVLQIYNIVLHIIQRYNQYDNNNNLYFPGQPFILTHNCWATVEVLQTHSLPTVQISYLASTTTTRRYVDCPVKDNIIFHQITTNLTTSKNIVCNFVNLS